jgi:hypothetical protein
MELTHGSETSAQHIMTLGKYPKEHLQYSNHGESLKSTNHYLFVIQQQVCFLAIGELNLGYKAIKYYSKMIHDQFNNEG